MNDQYGHEVSLPGPWRDMDEVRTANRRAGNHFFDADTLSFFQSRVSDLLYAGRLFVTSEKPRGGVREWTVRAAMDDGSCSTMEPGFRAFSTGAAAHRYARRLAAALDAPR